MSEDIKFEDIHLTEFDKVWVFPDLETGKVFLGIDWDFGGTSVPLSLEKVDAVIRALTEARAQVGQAKPNDP